MSNEYIDCDVLVIGGGIAGCFAALRAREAGLDVVLVNKGKLGRSGYSHQMAGVLTYFDSEEDDHQSWYKECVETGGGLGDLERFEGMVCETTDRIRDLEGWGVTFQKSGGKFIRKAGIGHKYARNVVMTDGGFQLMTSLREQMSRQGVSLVENVMVTDLLTSDGLEPTKEGVSGAAGLGVKDGRFYVISAKAVIIAAGCCDFDRVAAHLSGDGCALAWKVGCQMRNIELTMPTLRPSGGNILFGLGARLINRDNERFMARYDPDLMEHATRVGLARAIALEEMEGRGPIYLDARHIDEAGQRIIERAVPILIKTLKKAGVSLRKDRIRYTSTMYHSLGPGGIRVDKEGEASIAGLWAGGAASDHGEDGVINVISHGMLSAIGGHRAGIAAARYALETKRGQVDEKQIERIKEYVYAPLNRAGGMSYRQITGEFSEITKLLGMVRSEESLTDALKKIDNLSREKIPRLAAREYQELSRALGVKNQLLFLRLLAKCARYRRESRGGHYRLDYPGQDDQRWLRWVIAKRGEEDMEVWDEPLPQAPARQR
jgi:succinate dehydrogenase/fumarate reductase flavoprotein subunit